VKSRHVIAIHALRSLATSVAHSQGAAGNNAADAVRAVVVVVAVRVDANVKTHADKAKPDRSGQPLKILASPRLRTRQRRACGVACQANSHLQFIITRSR
jgi:hypothetical protein